MTTPNPELALLFDEDQGDRQGDPSQIDWEQVLLRDEARQQRVREILDATALQLSADYYHAAMVFQHGQGVEMTEMAHRLALRAVELDGSHRAARWLVAASRDRMLMRQGKPQEYGTQQVCENGRWQLHPVDPKITDEQRARWNVPPLAEAQAKVDALNRASPRRSS